MQRQFWLIVILLVVMVLEVIEIREIIKSKEKCYESNEDEYFTNY